ncbi:16S rRNA (guanine(966)-N(2))-methyltransferase RsmD [Candidatus Sumerlaeota bacterium]|nr:16S rRNA (guanine(966)-N(2))-methyltransferase RsmD [Candidatus Sumerlaeota bacterium]
MMRIIGGENSGMRLKTPKGERTRPTLARVRESLFMILQARLEEACALDLYAGAGGLGLEALSRGAKRAVFVENSKSAIEALRDNVARLGFGNSSRIIKADVLRFLQGGGEESERFDLILLDPPYGTGEAVRVLDVLGVSAARWLKPSGIVVAQVGKRDELKAEYGVLKRTFERGYGETRIEIFEEAG